MLNSCNCWCKYINIIFNYFQTIYISNVVKKYSFIQIFLWFSTQEYLYICYFILNTGMNWTCLLTQTINEKKKVYTVPPVKCYIRYCVVHVRWTAPVLTWLSDGCQEMIVLFPVALLSQSISREQMADSGRHDQNGNAHDHQSAPQHHIPLHCPSCQRIRPERPQPHLWASQNTRWVCFLLIANRRTSNSLSTAIIVSILSS